jgi:hypothetical protein
MTPFRKFVFWLANVLPETRLTPWLIGFALKSKPERIE